MRVVWTRPAEIDLEQFSDYIAADNPNSAASFVRKIIETGEALADMPRAFPLVARLEHRGVRQRGYGGYLIFYRVTQEGAKSCTLPTARATTCGRCLATSFRPAP